MLAWRTAQFVRTNRREKLADYLSKRPVRKQTPDEMFAILCQFKAGGAPLDIREMN